MKILLTGASSFTGCWFARALARAGHEVVATFRRPMDLYEGLRLARVELLLPLVRPVFNCSFGDPVFLELVEKEHGWGLLCHHGAEVSNYKSPEFDAVAAVAANARNVRLVLDSLAAQGCRKLLLTGSVFEPGEGAGSEGLPAFSPYGLSKALTAQVFAYHAGTCGMHIGKFVISNPFGPHEEPRFTSYLVRSWYEGRTPAVNTPEYVRDNIHISLLAAAYADFAAQLPDTPGRSHFGPSGYIETQGSFAERFAREMRPRLNLPCKLELKKQSEFAEPRIRVNTDMPATDQLGWSEARAWDEVAEYYQRQFAAVEAR